MTMGVIVSLLLGIAAVGLGVEDLRKINNLNTSINNKLNQVDFSVPATAVIYPTNGLTVSGIVPLDAKPLDGNAKYVEFQASKNGSHPVQIAMGGPSIAGFVTSWDSTKLANGTYQMTSVGYNEYGKSMRSAPVTVTVNNVGKL